MNRGGDVDHCLRLNQGKRAGAEVDSLSGYGKVARFSNHKFQGYADRCLS